jgi:multiple sugar transport system permease protein
MTHVDESTTGTTVQCATTPPDSPSPRKPIHRDARAAIAMIAPAVTVLLLFTYLPALLSFVASLFDVPLSGQGWSFVGLDNYEDVLGDPDVRQAVRNTVLYAVLTIVPSLAVGLGLALLVTRLGRTSTLVSTILFLPLTANLVAMAVVFRWIFALRGGFANELLSFVGVEPVNFLADERAALPTVAAVGVWRAASFSMVLFMAGLTSIPTAVHEAAAVDGLRGIRKLRLVILPMLRPTIVLATVLTTLQAVQVFDSVLVMTDGGPQGATETILTITWRIGFGYFELGRSSALSFLLLVFLLALGYGRRRALLRGGVS